MATTAQRPSLLVIVGPTASGKSDLALNIAKKFNGEIIAADSRTIYKGMDIGTAKPSKAGQKAVRHWGLDLVEPGQAYSVARFKKYAEAAIDDIQKRGKLPILVGGTGLYIDAVLFDYKFSSPGAQRDEQNPRHLKQGIQVGGRQPQPVKRTLIIGLKPSDDELRQRINKRADSIFKEGIKHEIQKLDKTYGEQALISTGGIIYKVGLRTLAGEIDWHEAKELFKVADWQYARRQKTWFRRNKFIRWYNDPSQAFKELSELLNK